MPIRGPVHAKLHKKDAAETLHVGPLTIRIYEDGSLTENRVSGVLLEIPAGKSGPPMHWHRFHDELFLVINGSMTFVTPDGEVTASGGDLMTVPPGAVHTFKNASDTEDCECYMTATPGHYVDYFRMLGKAAEGWEASSTSGDVEASNGIVWYISLQTKHQCHDQGVKPGCWRYKEKLKVLGFPINTSTVSLAAYQNAAPLARYCWIPWLYILS